ncbi:MAG: hypothetical protein ACRDBY_00965 [Cetobacterium sp.]
MEKKIEYVTTGGSIHITGEDSTTTRDNGIWEDNIPKRVVCIDNGGNMYIKVGNEYEVVDDEGLQDGLILIKNDTGNVGMYPKKLFKSKEDKNRNISLNLKFDTSALQSKLEKALYHLKELNKVMSEIGEGDVKVKVGK